MALGRGSKREQSLHSVERFYTASDLQLTFFRGAPISEQNQVNAKYEAIAKLEGEARANAILEFNLTYLPNRITETLSPATKEIKNVKAMGEIADELNMSEEFDNLCAQADRDNNPNILNDFAGPLYDAFLSKWINDKKFSKGRFEWQSGYGAFTYSRSQIKVVAAYIENQEKHHDKKTFKEEYIEFVQKFESNYDEKFIFEDLI